MLEGYNNHQIAEQLNCSVRTVERAVAERQNRQNLRQNDDDSQNLDKEKDKEEEIEKEEEEEKAIAINNNNNTIDIDSDSARQKFWQGTGKELQSSIIDKKELERVIGELAPKFGWEWLDYAMAGRAAAFNKHGFGLLYMPNYQEEVSEGLIEYRELLAKYGAQ